MNPKIQLTIIILLLILITAELGAITNLLDKATNAIGNAAFDTSTLFVEEK